MHSLIIIGLENNYIAAWHCTNVYLWLFHICTTNKIQGLLA